MPKKLKLNLNELKVQSFVTALTDEEKDKYRGAGSDKCDDTGGAATCVPCTNTCGTCSCGTACQTCSPSWCSGGANCC